MAREVFRIALGYGAVNSPTRRTPSRWRKAWPAHAAGGPARIAWTELDSEEQNERVIMVCDHPDGRY